ncbi:endonuclease III [uncultured Jannaschia sp.]|uniref:endonuclease III domain-containing protein n=1 Tax=uncultured Jannaschia sp. TaxID=293347 RepID=UPI00262B7ADE|nr:endonuclease III [uncultured Jannaschia sp.]
MTAVAETEKDDRSLSDENKHRLVLIYGVLGRTYPTFEETDDPWTANGLSATPFHTLVSTCLSTMTVTARVVKACVPLYEKVSSFEDLASLGDDELREIIRPVAHYNRKTDLVKRMARQIIDEHGGEIPRNRDELMELPGVGRKVADIMMNFEFSEDSIAVDTHVLRVLNRLGIVNTTSSDKAADIINIETPPRFKRHAHECLIQHGMKICVSRRPKCDDCRVTQHCDYYAEHECT